MTMTVDGTTIGKCLYGSEASINDYSRKDRDTFGNITIIKRGYTDVVTYKVEIVRSDAYQVKMLLASCRARKVLYRVTDVDGNAIPELTVSGYLNSFSIPLDNHETTQISLEVESDPQDAPLTVTFNLDGGTRIGGGALIQSIDKNGTAVAPTLTPPKDKTFTAWDHALSPITVDVTIKALYS